VGVVAHPGPDLPGAAGQLLGHDEILRIGQLEQHGIARNQGDLAASVGDHLGVIGRFDGEIPGFITSFESG